MDSEFAELLTDFSSYISESVGSLKTVYKFVTRRLFLGWLIDSKTTASNSLGDFLRLYSLIVSN